MADVLSRPLEQQLEIGPENGQVDRTNSGVASIADLCKNNNRE